MCFSQTVPVMPIESHTNLETLCPTNARTGRKIQHKLTLSALRESKSDRHVSNIPVPVKEEGS